MSGLEREAVEGLCQRCWKEGASKKTPVKQKDRFGATLLPLRRLRDIKGRKRTWTGSWYILRTVRRWWMKKDNPKIDTIRNNRGP